jgi:hypothetical protein
MTRAPSQPDDDWYASEQSTRLGLIAELQRIKRRMKARPLPVLALATIVTGLITYRVATKVETVTSEVVLALTEGALASGRKTGIPVDQLREYMSSVLLPDSRLAELIERRDLTRLRKKLGMQFAITDLRERLEIQIWKNSFVHFDEDDEHARRSARIGLAVIDTDADRALAIARDLANIAIQTLTARRQKLAETITEQVETLRKATDDKLVTINNQISATQAAIEDAIRSGKTDNLGILRVDLVALYAQRQRTEAEIGHIAGSSDAMAGDVAAAGLDMRLAIVEERLPERHTHSSFILVMIAVVVGTGALIGSATLLGAFDSRVHDTDDVVRLGLPVLGHVPGFAGDNVGSMQARSVARARVPSLLRWRSHR